MTTPDPVSIALIAGTVISTGLSVAQSTGAFGGEKPRVPGMGDAAKLAEDERRRRAMARGGESTILGGGFGASGAPGQVGVRSLLGG